MKAAAVSFVIFLSSVCVFAETIQLNLEKKYGAILSASPSTLDSLNSKKVAELYERLKSHPIASLSALSTYDKQKIGFCFGRAMAAHLIARKMGLKNEQIAKLFVIGKLQAGGDNWRFHVTTLVKSKETNSWKSIDPVVGEFSGDRALTIEEWIKTFQRIWDKKKKAHFYLTTSNAVIPETHVVPDLDEGAIESGFRIIELSFDPAIRFQNTKTVKLAYAGMPVYQVDEATEQKDFIGATEKQEDDRFNFEGLSINLLSPKGDKTIYFNYNRYFEDLIDNLEKPLVSITMPSQLKTLPKGPLAQGPSLYGFPAYK